MPASANSVADLIILEAHKRGIKDLTNRKLQKLLAYCQFLHLGRYDKEAFVGEIKAWTDGYVIPETRFPARTKHALATIHLDCIDVDRVTAFAEKETTIYDTVTTILDEWGQETEKQLIDRSHGDEAYTEARSRASTKYNSPAVANILMKTLSKRIAKAMPVRSRRDLSKPLTKDLEVHPFAISLESLMAKVTPQNRHAVLSWGAPRGQEVG